MRDCAMQNCDRQVGAKARSTTIYCAPCRSSLGYWDKMPVARIMTRREKLKLYATRVTHVITAKRRIR